MNKHSRMSLVEKRRSELRAIQAEKQKALQKVPEGYLRITNSRGNPQYYQVVDRKANSVTYLSKNNIKLVEQLAQKGYDQRVLKAAEQELKAWAKFVKLFPMLTAEEVFESLSPVRRKFITPIRQTDEEFRRQWESISYEPGYFRPETPVYMTDRGERVRSKSEQLIANMLFRLGIPYRYEFPITLHVEGRKKIWRPDFLILDVKNRKEYYLEHLGMLDDNSESNYARSAFWKMKIYEENDIYEGKNMIYSFETSRAPLDITYLERKVRRTLDTPPER